MADSPSTGSDTAIDRSTEIEADVAEVWDAMTDPDTLGSWLGAEVDLDLRPGGVGRVVDPDGTVRQVLVTDVDEAERVAWHWWADDGPLTSVEITLTPTPSGTRVGVTEIYARSPGITCCAQDPATVSLEPLTPVITWLARTPAHWSVRLLALNAARPVAASR